MKSLRTSKTLKGTYRFLYRHLTLKRAFWVWASVTVGLFLMVLGGVYTSLPSAPPGESWYVLKLAMTSSANLFLGRENPEERQIFECFDVFLSRFSLLMMLLIGMLFAANRRLILSWIYGQVEGGYLVYGEEGALREVEKKARESNRLVLLLPAGRSAGMHFWERETSVFYRRFKITKNRLSNSRKSSRKIPHLRVGVMRRTSEVFAISSNDLENISFVNELIKSGVEKNRVHFTIYISNDNLRKQVIERLDFIPHKKIESIYDRFARRVVLFQASDSLRFLSKPVVNHAVVIGDTAQGSALANRLIRQSARTHGGTFQLTLVCSVAGAKISSWTLENAESIPFVSLNFFDLAIDDDSSVIPLLENFKRYPPTAIYLCFGSSEKNTSLGLSLARKMEDLSLQFPRFFIFTNNKKAAKSVQGIMTLIERFHFNFLFDGQDLNSDHSGIQIEGFDRFPSALHTNYLKACLERGESMGARPTLKSWEDLPENFKEDNRLLADHFLQKCREQGLFVKVSKCGKDNHSFIAASGVQENFAISEHKRWWINKAQEGWVYGDIRNDNAKSHPDMVEWEKLPAEAKLKDYDMTMPMLISPSLYGLEIKKNIYFRVRSVEFFNNNELTPKKISIIARHLSKQIPIEHAMQDRKVVVVGSLKVYQDVLILDALCDLLNSPLALIEYPEFWDDIDFYSSDQLLITQMFNNIRRFCYLFLKAEPRVNEVDSEMLKSILDFSGCTDLIDLSF